MSTTTSTNPAEVRRLASAAERSFTVTASASPAARIGWLHAVAEVLDENVDDLVQLADAETSLGVARLTGEVARTSGQLRLFADVVAEGSYLEAVIDHAVPSATPPRPELRRLLRPIGPVAVFAASNFPFAFSVAGGDTASALAVGCPVIVKAHPGHPELSRRTGELVTGALRAAGAPEGVFAVVEGYEAGLALVDDPAIRAVAFTGSLAGGRALHDRAARRPSPIPFFGELGSLNPVVVTPGADAAGGARLAEELAASFQLGAGQFCTKPGVVFVPQGSALERALPEHVGAAPAALLTSSIATGYDEGVRRLAAIDGVSVVAGGVENGARPVVLAVDASTLAERQHDILTEVFGPVTVLVRYTGDAQGDDLGRALDALEGSLTATLHAAPGEEVAPVLARLENLAGRVLFEGWPTGVAVTWAQHHGGPWPATTSGHTSVGATAVRRFLRPIAYQSAPADSLPEALRDDNPLRIPRRVDGRLVLP
ncbi:aldehyde dehydrogenase (NADP(+)) [Herbiconiux sp. KACC 21604]|uniref:aldehyde dehydrogenase (NADP(+)) n=1 Tax=unclassified Herbiconiux TaxID=2618217 RepID=UPI001491883D|nr:aldehyde dehydrogenase (NADP(+)) [Herbiconiux sp. SALV-R1]QJU55698.1 aldehyde dehydrogenase (NADP(+)) [Herbiconiux sp. SALV-R1]WPO86901.1 aldehyde dehydrogenase (NADP(+)) [Herbiconiux sp. KACC 21604]